MVESIPKHLLEKISLLYSEFESRKFGFQEAVSVLQQNERYSGLILSQLVQAGWISKRRDPKDKRRKIYQIENLHEILQKIGETMRDNQ